MRAGAAEAIAARVRAAPSLEDAAAQADFLLEAVTESPEVKRAVYRRAEAVIADEAIMLTTTPTQQMVEAAGLTTFRFPGGSSLG